MAALRRVVDAVREHGTVFVSQLYHLGANADPLAGRLRALGARRGPGARRAGRSESDGRRGYRRARRGPCRSSARCACCRRRRRRVHVRLRHARRPVPFGRSATPRTTITAARSSGRARLAREILLALRAEVGPDRLLGITVTAAMEGYEEAVAHLAARVRHRLRRRRPRQLRAAVPDRAADGASSPDTACPFAARAKRAAPGLAIIAEGRINGPEIGERALAEGACDLVGMTRALIVDPLVPTRARDGQSDRIRVCIGYNLCIARRYRKFPIACVQNPHAGQERALGDLSRSRRGARRARRRSAGLAGLEAARVAAERGHRVTVLERACEAGWPGAPDRGASRSRRPSRN